MIFKVFFLFCLPIVCNALVVVTRTCQNSTAVTNFDVKAFSGTWYEISRFSNSYEVGNCSSTVFTPLDDGRIKMKTIAQTGSKETSFEGYATFDKPNSTEAKFTVKHNSMRREVRNYWILATDYNHYAVVWTCTFHGWFNIQFAWVLARERPLSLEHTKIVNKILADNSISTKHLEVHQHPLCEKRP